MQSEVEVDHLSGWSHLEWWLHVAGAIAAPMVAAALVGLLILVVVSTAGRAPALVDAIVPVVAIGVGISVVGAGVVVHSRLVLDTLRHATSMPRSFFTAIAIGAVLAVVAVVVAVMAGLNQTRWLVGIGGSVATPALGCLIYDALTRAAASIPMALSTFLLLIVLVALWVFASQSQR